MVVVMVLVVYVYGFSGLIVVVAEVVIIFHINGNYKFDEQVQ